MLKSKKTAGVPPFTMKDLIEKYTMQLYKLQVEKLREQKVIQAQIEKRRQAIINQRNSARKNFDLSPDGSDSGRGKKSQSPSPKRKEIEFVKVVDIGELLNVEESEEEDLDELALKANHLHKLIAAKKEREFRIKKREEERKLEQKRIEERLSMVRPGEGIIDWKSIVEAKRRK